MQENSIYMQTKKILYTKYNIIYTQVKNMQCKAKIHNNDKIHGNIKITKKII